MSKNKLAALLLLGAISIGTLGANAATSATQTLTLTLPATVDVTTNGGTIAANIDTTTGNLSAQLTPAFQVKSNKASGTTNLYLQASTTSAGGPTNAFFQDGANNYIMFANTDSAAIPTAAALTNCSSASPVVATNANVIAYQVTGVALGGASTGTGTFDNTKKQFSVAVSKGTSSVTTTVAVAPRSNTFSFDDDNSGSYVSTMTLTTTSL